MNSRKVLLAVLFTCFLALPAFGQDGGAPDSVKLVFTTPPSVGTNVPVVVECSVFVDVDQLSTVQIAWQWDNPNLQMDSAKAWPPFSSMAIGPFFFLDNDIATTNDSQVAICSGTSIFNHFPPDPSGWRRIATYYMTVSSWTAASSILIDSVQLAGFASTEYIFLPLGGQGFDPIWGGPLTIGSAAKNLQVSPDTINLNVQEGAPSPADDTVDVTEAGGGSIGFNISETAAWFSTSKASGTTPDNFSIIYNTSSLAAGTYTDSIEISSVDADNSPVYVHINLQVQAVTKFLNVAPDTLYFTAQQGGADPAPDSFLVSETGGFNIPFDLLESATWFSLNQAAGTTPDYVGVSVVSSGLAPGVYFDSIRVSSASASNTPVYEYVRLQVNATRFLAVSPDTIKFVATEGGSDPAPARFFVAELGGANIAYTLAESSLWFSLDKSGGTTPDSVLVTATMSGLSPGNHLDSIQVASAEANNSPIYEYVSLEIVPAAKLLVVTPDTLYFVAQEGGPNPPPDTFVVTEAGGASIAYNLLETSTWMSLNKPGGTTPDVITVSVNSAIAPGTYLDSVQVSSGAASNSPIFEYVVLEITPVQRFLAVSPDTIRWSKMEGGPNPPPDSFMVSETGGGSIAFTLAKSASWFFLNKNAGTTPEWVTILPDTDLVGLPPGVHYGDITVTSAEAVNSPLTVTVELTITAVPKVLEVFPTSLNLTMTEGGPPFSPVPVYVSDSASMNYSYSLSENSSWFNAAAAIGVTPDSFLVLPDTLGLNTLLPGTYHDSILVSAAGAINSPVAVSVWLEVLAPANGPPVISPVSDTTIFEGDTLVLVVSATDPDGDSLILSSGPVPPNMTFFDSGNGTGVYTFMPDFTQAGDYDITLFAADSIATVADTFRITVLNKVIGSEGDTLAVGSVPAVPGQQVVLPIDIVNGCDVFEIIAPIRWQGGAYITLDSVLFNDSVVGSFGISSAVIQNDSNYVLLKVSDTDVINTIPPGSYRLADMYFSVDCFVPLGVYPITPVVSFIPEDTSTYFGRVCDTAFENVLPTIPGGGGNIIIDSTTSFVCGYVITPDSVGISGATVELWPDWPSVGPVMTTTTNGSGTFAFANVSAGSFDLYAFKNGSDTTNWNDAYYPNTLHVNLGEIGVMIILHPVEPITPTDRWVDYFCDQNTLHGAPLPIGSIVEARDPQNILCGRQFVLSPGIYRFMPVYRDSIGTALDEGATTDDHLRFFINGNEAIASGNTIYPAQWDTMRVCLEGAALDTAICGLRDGWNLVSWNLDTPTDSIEAVLRSLDGCIEVVLGFLQGGLTYVPGMDLFNTLNQVSHLYGVWIKVKPPCNSDLIIEGVPVAPNTPIPVYSGWNLVSYLPNDVLPVDSALASLSDLQVAYTFDSIPFVYVPGQDLFNTLEFMHPCFGYWVKIQSDGSLIYPGIGNAAPDNSNDFYMALAKSNKSDVTPTQNWVNLYSYNLTVDGVTVPSGATVTAHTSAGDIIGQYTMKNSGQFGFMPVYADDNNETAVGIKKGETFYLSVDGLKTNEKFVWSEQGGLIEVAALTTSSNLGVTLPGSYSLSQNFPNPFNPTTTINFTLPVAGQARIEIFNLLGQLVAVPFDGFAEAGETSTVWDGRTLSGETAASGIYLYRLVTDDYVENRKMTLLK